MTYQSEAIFNNAELALAAYANLDKGPVDIEALKAKVVKGDRPRLINHPPS